MTRITLRNRIVSAVLAAAVSAVPVLSMAGAAEAAVHKKSETVTAEAKTSATTGYRQQYTQELAGSGAWCWFADPRAVYYAGKYKRTYVGWIDRSGAIMVASYDHTTTRRTSTALMHNFQRDDHNNPALVIRPDGRVMVFWSAHAGNAMYYRLTSNPEDITSFGPTMTVGANVPGNMGYTYPNPVQLKNEGNKLYLFWRGGNFNPTFSTTMDGKTWTPARNLISVPGMRPYMKVASDGLGTIHFAFTDGHPRDQKSSIYYMRYTNGSFYKADGTRIGGMADLPFKPSQTDRVYDYNADQIKSWTHDVAFDAQGRPVITFATFPAANDHRYHYARWMGDHWLDVELTHAGGTISGDPYENNYSGGITLDHENPNVVLMSRPIKGIYEIQRWTTTNGDGVNWKVEDITSNSKVNNYRPITPRGQQGGDMDVIWMSGDYPSYANFETLMKRTGSPVANPAPTSMFSPSTYSANAPAKVSFNGKASSDTNGTVKLYQWSFGDGSTATGATPAHTYTRPGRYWVRLLVTDNGNGRDERSDEIVVKPATTTRLFSSVTPGTVSKGQSVTVTGRLVSAASGAGLAGQTVEVYGRTKGTTAWVLLASPKTAADGSIRYSRKPGSSVEFTLRHRGSASTIASAGGILSVWMK
jgi:PKD repeat protein